MPNVMKNQNAKPNFDHSFGDVVLKQNIMVPMRDGINLATDIYLPETEFLSGKALPVLLERTPYDKSGISRGENDAEDLISKTRIEVALWFARRGYICVMQDCRGRYMSEGEFVKYVNEARDGFDTMEWLVNQSWCDGRVGTMGLSYGAHTQTALASLHPKGLAAMFIDSGGFSSAYHSGIRQGGAFELKQATWAYRHALRSQVTQNDPERKKALEQVDIKQWFKDMPWRRGHSPLTAAPEYEAYLFDMWEKGLYDDYWRQPGLSSLDHYDQFPDVPVAIVGSWYDPYVTTCITNYQELAKRHKAPTRLLMGPWTHGDRSLSYAGDIDFGSRSILDGNIYDNYLELKCAWFDAILKVGDLEKLPFKDNITYFRMGGGSGHKDGQGRLLHGGEWQENPIWPPEGAEELSLFLSPTGELVEKPETEINSSLEYDYDPHNPVLTRGGAITSGDPVMWGGGFNQQDMARDDVLSFYTEPLTEDFEVTGPVRVRLWVSTDCPDTDFTLKLMDCYPPSEDYPEGYDLNLTDGILRLRYREGWDREVFSTPGEIYEITIEAFATSNLFRKGHRLRLDISSSNFPHYDLNSNSGEREGHSTQYRTAKNRIHFASAYRPQLSLYRVRR